MGICTLIKKASTFKRRVYLTPDVKLILNDDILLAMISVWGFVAGF